MSLNWGINDLMINIKIRYKDKDYHIVLDSKSIQIIIFLFLIVIIVVLGVVVVPSLLNNNINKIQRKIVNQASFDDHDNKKVLGNSITDDNDDNRFLLQQRNSTSTTTPTGFKIRTNLNITPTECNGDDENYAMMEICSENSNISYESNMGDCELNIGKNDFKSIKFVIDSSNVIELSNNYPDVLIGWRIHIQNYGFGVVTDTVKRKMRSTKFRIAFDVPLLVPGSPYKKSNFDLLLHRSDKKKGLPFSVVKKVI
jgi:hypothetical protein